MRNDFLGDLGRGVLWWVIDRIIAWQKRNAEKGMRRLERDAQRRAGTRVEADEIEAESGDYTEADVAIAETWARLYGDMERGVDTT